MELYRAQAGDGVAWITGASSGLGRELAFRMAQDGYIVAASARNAGELGGLVEEAAGARGAIRAVPCDTTDRQAMAAAVGEIERQAGPIRLAVFNAGTYVPTRGEAIDLDVFARTFEVNLLGTLNGLAPVLERMKAHGRGQVVLVASASGYSGLPAAAAYGASKAALINLAESLRFDLDKINIRVQVINPGFVDTPATRLNDFEMPSLMTVQNAVEAMQRGIETGGFEVTFPRRFTWQLKLLRMLPHPLYFRIMERATGWRKRPSDFGETTPAAVLRAGQTRS